MLRSPQKLTESGNSTTPFDKVLWSFCSLLTFDLGPEMSEKVCKEKINYKVTGLLGIPTDIEQRRFSSGEQTPLDLLNSRFVTIELDLEGD